MKVKVTYIESIDEFVPNPIDKKHLCWKPF